MTSVELRVRVLLTLQVALLGRVTANMRAVLVSWTEKEIWINFRFDQPASPQEIELVSEVETEVISHLPDHLPHCQIDAIACSNKLDINLGEVLVFHRFENS